MSAHTFRRFALAMIALSLGSCMQGGDGGVDEQESAVTYALDACQRLSNEFGLAPGGVWGFAPNDIRASWTASACATSPNTSTNLCQKASEIFGITANVTWGFAPAEVQDWWKATSCQTSPLLPETSCERAADTYNMDGQSFWGTAPPYIRSWWTMSGCQAKRRVYGECLAAANFWGIKANVTWGAAPAQTRTWWTSVNCQDTARSSTAYVCQDVANAYGIVAGQSMGGAPAEVQTWFNQNGCTASATCQGVSEVFATRANVTWGSAGAPASPVPTFIQNWWINHGCQTTTLFDNDACQHASDTFGMASYSINAGPDFVSAWWRASACNTSNGKFSEVTSSGPLSGPWFYMPNSAAVLAAPPTSLSVTGKTASTLSFSYVSNNKPTAYIQVLEVVNGQEVQRGSIVNVPAGNNNSSIPLTGFANQTTPCIRLRAAISNQSGAYSMASSTACWSAPPPTMVNLGFGNGVFFCTPDLSLCNINAVVNQPFKVSWFACNNGSVAVGATTTRVTTTDNNGNQVSQGVTLPSVPANQCIQQATAAITITTAGNQNWDVFLDALNQVTETFETDNFSGIEHVF
jgi:hypothetical protein